MKFLWVFFGCVIKHSSEQSSWIQKNSGRVAAGVVGISALVWFLLRKYAQKQLQKKLQAQFKVQTTDY
jgi:hypothetical protein